MWWWRRSTRSRPKQLPHPDVRVTVSAVDSGLQEEYGDSGFKKRYGRALATGQPTSEISVDESVIEFDTPYRAADFVKRTPSTWPRMRPHLSCTKRRRIHTAVH